VVQLGAGVEELLAEVGAEDPALPVEGRRPGLGLPPRPEDRVEVRARPGRRAGTGRGRAPRAPRLAPPPPAPPPPPPPRAPGPPPHAAARGLGAHPVAEAVEREPWAAPGVRPPAPRLPGPLAGLGPAHVRPVQRPQGLEEVRPDGREEGRE